MHVLQLRNASARWVLRAFTVNTAVELMAYLRSLQHYTLGGHTWLRRVLTGGEIWHFTPTSKRSATEQEKPQLSPTLP